MSEECHAADGYGFNLSELGKVKVVKRDHDEAVALLSVKVVERDIRIGELAQQLAAANARIAELERACAKQNDEIEQTLGKALGYPWYKDDQKNFPGATEADGVCVWDHVAESLAMEAANRLAKFQQTLQEIAYQGWDGTTCAEIAKAALTPAAATGG